MCIISTLLSIHVANFMRKIHTVFKLLQDPLFPIVSQWKVQVAIATKVFVGLTNEKTCKISTLPSIHLLSFMRKYLAMFKLSQDPDFAGRTDRRTDTRTEGKPKIPSGQTPVGDKSSYHSNQSFGRINKMKERA